MGYLKKRFWEIDFLRGIAIVMMVVFHFLWDLNYFFDSEIVLRRGFWSIFQMITLSVFLFLVGVSLTISHRKKGAGFMKYLRRGLTLIFFGIVITFFSMIIFPESLVMFGVLHMIGVSVIVTYPFRNLKHINLVIGLVLVLIGMVIRGIRLGHDWLLPLGLHSWTFSSIDYAPLLPWLGVVFIGLFFGNVYYGLEKRNFGLRDLSRNRVVRVLCFLGRWPLVIYFAHLVVLFGILYGLKSVL